MTSRPSQPMNFIKMKNFTQTDEAEGLLSVSDQIVQANAHGRNIFGQTEDSTQKSSQKLDLMSLEQIEQLQDKIHGIPTSASRDAFEQDPQPVQPQKRSPVSIKKPLEFVPTTENLIATEAHFKLFRI